MNNKIKIIYNLHEKVGNLLFLKEIDRLEGELYRKALFKCHCGKEFVAKIRDVKSLNTKSCGCSKNIGYARTHGMSNTVEYNIYNHMMNRCYNMNVERYPNYGGRGIKVCDKWQTFEGFFGDMGKRPSVYHSIDRIDVNGDYTPQNCRWATIKEQSRNKTNTKFIEYRGEVKPLCEWTDILNLRYKTVHNRLSNKMSTIDAFEVS